MEERFEILAKGMNFVDHVALRRVRAAGYRGIRLFRAECDHSAPKLIQDGLMKTDGERFYLTPLGREFLNELNPHERNFKW